MGRNFTRKRRWYRGFFRKERTDQTEMIRFAVDVLNDFRANAGRLPVETGGLLGSTKDPNCIDLCHFDTHSENSPGTFYYDVESMSAVFRDWKAHGYITNGIYHSHPEGAIRPSYHDISTALLHLDFFRLDYFYMPILQPGRNGCYDMYFYVVRKQGKYINVNLDYRVQANPDNYEFYTDKKWKKDFSIAELRDYRAQIDGVPAKKEEPKKYFRKVSGMFPEHVLDKVIVCIGTGGARSFLENLARCGFRNFILMDADTVSDTNIATQGVFISEIGRKKTNVIKNRILDINPGAQVVSVNRFLDDRMSDGEFRRYLSLFPGKRGTDYLLLGCTDNFAAQKRSALLAMKYGLPYMAAMMYAKGAAAEVIFTYPGVTPSCPRCLLRDRFEKYENGFVNEVTSEHCLIFATERMNALKGYIAVMLLMYGEEAGNPYSSMLERIKDRNFVEIRLDPDLMTSPLGIGLFDRVLGSAARYTFMDETLWIPQHPDNGMHGEEPCRLCGGSGDLRDLQYALASQDTRYIRFDRPQAYAMIDPRMRKRWN